LNHFWNRRLALYQIAQQVLALTAISILINHHRPLIECAGVIVCSSIIVLASMALEVHRRVHLRPSINKLYAFWFIREAAPVGFSTLLLAMYQRADVLLLGVEGTSIQVGYYGIVMAISSFFVMIPTTLTRNFMPLISRPDRDHWLATLRDLQNYSWALGFGSVVAIESTAPYVVHLFAGSEYVAAVTPLRILCVGLLASFIIPILTLMSLTRGTQRSMVRPTLLMLIVNVVLNAVVIPRYGIAGCAWATVASEFTGLAVMTRVVQRELRLRPSQYLRPLPAAAAAATALAAVWPLWHFHPASFLQLIISLVVVTVVFGSVLAMCGGFPRSIQKIVLPGRRSRPGKWMRLVIRDPWTR
jgi:O-antigen/teichoic acid export membrane protein